MKTKFGRLITVGALAGALLVSATTPFAINSASAQEATTVPPTTGTNAPAAQQVTDEGFDDWGLLGLLGLAGLAGLRRQPERTVTVDRTATR